MSITAVIVERIEDSTGEVVDTRPAHIWNIHKNEGGGITVNIPAVEDEYDQIIISRAQLGEIGYFEDRERTERERTEKIAEAKADLERAKSVYDRLVR